MALTHAARSVSTGANSRKAAAKAQANAGRITRTMPALGLSMVVYGLHHDYYTHGSIVSQSYGGIDSTVMDLSRSHPRHVFFI